MCGDERAVERASPDGRLVARSFVRNCGATTAYVGLVEVRRNRWWSRDAHTVFVGEWVQDLSISWNTAGQLAIACNGCPSLRSRVTEVPGVHVVLLQSAERDASHAKGNRRLSAE